MSDEKLTVGRAYGVGEPSLPKTNTKTPMPPVKPPRKSIGELVVKVTMDTKEIKEALGAKDAEIARIRAEKAEAVAILENIASLISSNLQLRPGDPSTTVYDLALSFLAKTNKQEGAG